MCPDPVVSLDQLTKTFRVRCAGGSSLFARAAALFAPATKVVTAVDDVSFSIAPGERVAFIGPNGAGKSTTLKVLSGILFPDAGHVEVLGLCPSRDRRRLGFQLGTVFGQRSQLWYRLPPRDTFRLLARVYELDDRVGQDRLAELASAFGLAELLDRPVRNLSLGERMRCEIAASLLHRPRVLFLDEPTIGLDVAAKATIREVLRRQADQDGSTLLLTSHDTGDIEQVCDRVIVIHRGRVLSDGPIVELRRKYLHRRRVTFVGDVPGLSFATPGVSVVAREHHQTTVDVELDRVPIGLVIDAALEQGELRDLRIEDPPLDEVIRAMYDRAERSPEP